METIREVGNYSLCYESLQGMFCLSDEEGNTSLWFDGFGAEDLMGMSEEDFEEECLFLIE